MTAIPLSTIRTRVQQLGNYENSARFTPAFVDDQINAALVEFHELLSSVHEGYFDTETTLTTTANVATVNLPADFWRERGLDIQIVASTAYEELRQISIAERNRYALTGRPVAYRITSGGTRGAVRLYPTPDATYTLRLTYEPTRTALSADGDTVEDYNGLIEFVVQGALLRLDRRDNRPLGEREAELERIRKRVLASASERRAAEPEYLVPRAYDITTADLWNGGG